MAGDSEPKKRPPLSCTSCRARKLKCDKQDPCHHCARSGTECVFPARKRIQRPRKTKNTELLQRLSRLEAIVGKVGLANLEELEPRAQAASGTPDITPQLLHPAVRVNSGGGDGDGDVVRDIKDTRPPQGSTASRYMGSEFWSTLCNEVGGLRQVLEQATDSDDEDEDGGGGEETTPESLDSASFSVSTPPRQLLGGPHAASSHVADIEHPSPRHIRYLASVYFEKVDLHFKILHRPTILPTLHHLADHPHTASDLSLELTALFFAMYYAAITSLTTVECSRNLGRPRTGLAVMFEAGLVKTLTRVDYLNSTSLVTLQALTLYTCCLRSHNGSRAAWVLLGLPVRLAQAMNLHREGDGASSRFTPFEAEMRRRLWWQLMVLDIRAAEDRGTGALVMRGNCDTRLPHNINDDDFGPETAAPLRDRPGPTDITFSLLTARVSDIFSLAQQGGQNPDVERDILQLMNNLKSQFMEGVDPNHAGSYIASAVVGLIVPKMWLLTRYPLRPRDVFPAVAGQGKTPGTAPSIGSAADMAIDEPDIPTPPGTAASPDTLDTAVSVIERAHVLVTTGPYADRTRWWCETYVQWHALAVALAELCTQTRGEHVEHAWRIIDTIFPIWSNKIADAKRGSLWRPIRKLYKKAREARGEAVKQDVASPGGEVDGGRFDERQQQPRPPPIAQTQQAQPVLGSQLSSLAGDVNYMAIDPTLAADSTNPDGLRPRLITDMTLSESSAYTLTSESSMPYATMANEGLGTDVGTNPSPGPSPFQDVRRDAGPGAESTPLDVLFTMSNSGQSMAQTLLAWPDVSFDMPATHSTDTHHHTAPSQASPYVMADTTTIANPSPLGANAANQSTWDEFVSDVRTLNAELWILGGEGN